MRIQTLASSALATLSLVFASTAPAVEIAVSANPPGPIGVGEEITVSLSIADWNATDPQVDGIAFNVDFDLAVFEFVSGSGLTLADGSEFLALPSQAAGYNLGNDSSEALVSYGRYIFGASDTGDGTAGSIGPNGEVGSFRLLAIAPGVGTIRASTNLPKQVFSDPDYYGIDPTGGVALNSTDVIVTSPAFTYATWAATIPFENEQDALPLSDPEADGRNNILEYFLDANPLKDDPERDPIPGIAEDDQLKVFATLSYERPTGAAERSDAKDQGERSTDLALWERSGVVIESIGPIDPNTGRETVVLRSETPIEDLNEEFMRLAVELVQ